MARSMVEWVGLVKVTYGAPKTADPPTTMMSVAYALQTAAEDAFDAWLAQQPADVRALAEAEQVELWAEAATDV